MRGGKSAPKDEVYPWNRWYTRRTFAPGACPWSMLQEQNPSCVGLKGMWVANQYQGRLCGLIGGIIDPSSSTLRSPISLMYFPLQVLRHSLCKRKITIHLKSRAQGELCLFPLFLLSWQWLQKDLFFVNTSLNCCHFVISLSALSFGPLLQCWACSKWSCQVQNLLCPYCFQVIILFLGYFLAHYNVWMTINSKFEYN